MVEPSAECGDATPCDGATSADFGWALGRLLRAYLDGARGAVSDLPGGPRGYEVLTIAAGGACRNQAAIAENLGVDRTVMTYLIDELEQGGLVERRPDPSDRRARQIVLTRRGRRKYDRAVSRVSEVERDVLAGLGDVEAAQFRDLLMRVTTSAPDGQKHTACEVAP